MGIARHKLLDHYRRERDRVHLTGDSPQVDDIPLDLAPGEARGRAVSALTTVPTAQRRALVLVYVDGFSTDEAAAQLGRGVEALEALLARARESFKRAYQEETR